MVWSLIIEPGTRHVVDLENTGRFLHISKATLDLGSTAGMLKDEHISLMMDYEKQPSNKGVILCNLNEQNNQQDLDLYVDGYRIVTLYSSNNKATIHVYGYFNNRGFM